MRPLATALLLVVGLAAAPTAATAQAKLDASSAAVRAVEALPPQLGAFRRVGPITDYEQRPNGAGLGASARYVPASGEQRMAVTIYIYDRGRVWQPEGASSPQVAQELRTVGAEVNAMVQAGRYQSATPGSGMGVGSPSGPDSARCASFSVVQQDGAPTGDSACVAVQQGSFLKVRVTTWTPPDASVANTIAASLISEAQRALAAGGGAAPRIKSRL